MKKLLFLAPMIVLIAAACNNKAQPVSQDSQNNNPVIAFITPQANEQVVVGLQYKVEWDKPVTAAGYIYLHDAADNNGAGFVAGYIGVGESQFIWDTTNLLASRSDGKRSIQVKPGQYYLQFGFDNSEPKPFQSGIFNLIISGNQGILSQSKIYENQYMKVTVPGGWKAAEAVKTVYNGSVAVKSPNPAAVNITKGNYTLYINTQASQASGAEGGRFAEIAMGAPSADAVVTEQPSPPCGTSENHPAILDHPRVDLYVSSKDKTDYCNVPTNGKTVWYFSYITNSSNGYFNYYKNDTPPGFVITMAYNSKTVNSFPVKGSMELNQALDDMTTIIKSLDIKQQPVAQPDWKNAVYNQFIGLTDWKVQDNLSAWQFADYTYESQRGVQLKKYGAGNIILLSKSFNENGFANPGDDQKAYTDQKTLESSIKKILSDNGWQPVTWPTEPSFYTDYLFVKDNHPLDFQVGGRDAVTGGMYVRVEFQY